jgi:hypothetical protein
MTASPGKMSNAITMIRSYFQGKPGVPSPIASNSEHTWYSAPPCLRAYDTSTINVFLDLAATNLSRTFPSLLPLPELHKPSDDLVLAVAAVGALYCDVDGSEKLAKACYNDARRMLFAKVGFSTWDEGAELTLW